MQLRNSRDLLAPCSKAGAVSLRQLAASPGGPFEAAGVAPWAARSVAEASRGSWFCTAGPAKGSAP
eukprot:6092384-Lingulodinium_polyedra.AAC.1